ncbi:OCIA domain-containing protein 1 [Tupaia chinensis]|uniref:OCIA domain-containing protein 1 n=1 Tax=Tupaia chinensis TaxID=246437 RepID=L9LD22_TUPCH|nr:OCIA domain-containing protein 1 [Tupaia chinensis]
MILCRRHYSQKSKYDSTGSGQSSFGTSPAADSIEKVPALSLFLHYSQKSKYDSTGSGQSSFGTSPAADSIEKEMLPHYEPIPFSASMNESTPTGITDHVAQDSCEKLGLPGTKIKAVPGTFPRCRSLLDLTAWIAKQNGERLSVGLLEGPGFGTGRQWPPTGIGHALSLVSITEMEARASATFGTAILGFLPHICLVDQRKVEEWYPETDFDIDAVPRNVTVLIPGSPGQRGRKRGAQSRAERRQSPTASCQGRQLIASRGRDLGSVFRFTEIELY